MYCKLCQKHDMMPFGRDTWNRTPCRRLREESIVDHETSESHKKAEKKETIAALCGNVMERFQPAIPGDEVCAALSCLYFLCKNNMAYVTNFEPLLDLTTHLGLLIKDGIRVGKNAHYTSPGAIMEMLYALSGTIEKEVLDELRQSESYALMFDETTDCSVTEQMVIHCRFLDSKGKLQVRFLKVIDALVSADKSNTESVVSLNADVISKCVTDYIEQNQLDYGKLRGIGTDGAAVMIGSKNGAVKKICEHQLNSQGPLKCEAVGQHCSAHRLNLAVSQAGDRVQVIKSFKNTLRQLFDFYNNSAVRSAGLAKIQRILEETLGKVKEPSSTRWLSIGQSAIRLKGILQSVIVSLDHEGEDRGDARAIGLHKMVTQFNFVATLLLLCDVLPVVNQFSLALQPKMLDHCVLNRSLTSTLVTLKALQSTEGSCLKSLDTYLKTLESAGGVQIKLPKGVTDFEIAKKRFKTSVQSDFLTKLIDNIENRFKESDVFIAFDDVFNTQRLMDNHNQGPVVVCMEDDIYGKESVIKLAKRFALDKQDAVKEWCNFINFACVDSPVDFLKVNLVTELCENQSLKALYPNLSVMAGAYRVIPPHTADCERDFSQLKLIKTDIRNRMKEETLDALMRISIDGPPLEQYDFVKAAELWSSVKSRRLKWKRK